MNSFWIIEATWKNLCSRRPAPCNHNNWIGLIRSAAWKESNANCEAGLFQLRGWLMPYGRLMLNIHTCWCTRFPDPFCPSNGLNLATCFAAQLCRSFFDNSGALSFFISTKWSNFFFITPYHLCMILQGFFFFFYSGEKCYLEILASATEFGLKHPFVISQWYLVYLF